MRMVGLGAMQSRVASWPRAHLPASGGVAAGARSRSILPVSLAQLWFSPNLVALCGLHRHRGFDAWLANRTFGYEDRSLPNVHTQESSWKAAPWHPQRSIACLI
jgi:hypothetical protein